jgi:Tol biopolymer transport system component
MFERPTTVVTWKRALLVPMLLVAAACGGPTPTAPPSPPPIESPAASEEASTPPTVGAGEEWIAFQGVALGFTLIRPDGTGSHVILGPPGDQVHPDWSPDGSQLAYVQATDATREVWITDPQGTNPEPLLTDYPAELSGLFWDNPAWSRDGTQIAMVGYEGNPDAELPARSVLAVVEVDSDEITIAGEFAQPAGFLHSFPRWSPDGNALVINVDHFTGEEFEGSTVAIIRMTGIGWSEPDPITDVGWWARPDWHPTDDLIVFCTFDVGGFQSTDEPSNLFTIRPDGTELTQITDFGPGEARASQPTWTSDGRIIFTYITGADDEQRNIALINADGSGLEIVSDDDAVGQSNRPHPRLRPVP